MIRIHINYKSKKMIFVRLETNRPRPFKTAQMSLYLHTNDVLPHQAITAGLTATGHLTQLLLKLCCFWPSFSKYQ